MSKLHQVEIHRLRPPQITVGMIEVHDKRDHLLGLKKHQQRDLMAAHPIPAVWGPDGRLYITDHQHLGRAASEAEADTGLFVIEDDFSKVPIAQFLAENERRGVGAPDRPERQAVLFRGHSRPPREAARRSEPLAGRLSA
jgi:hypothetical protein